MTQITKKEMISKGGHEKIVMQIPEGWDQKERALISTSTGELFMPARLYFKFINKKALIKALERRRCIDLFTDDTFNINYWEEARTVKLKVPYDEVPENVFPVLLACGSFVGPSEVHIDVRSFERAVGILKFLNKYIGPKFMYATHIATYNRLTGTQGKDVDNILNLDYDEIFSEEKLQQAEQDFIKISNNENNDNQEVVLEKFEAMLKQPIPVVQKVPVKNTQAGLNQLQFSLTFAQLFAQAYWESKEDFGPVDMLSMLFDKEEEKKKKEESYGQPAKVK